MIASPPITSFRFPDTATFGLASPSSSKAAVEADLLASFVVRANAVGSRSFGLEHCRVNKTDVARARPSYFVWSARYPRLTNLRRDTALTALINP